MWICLNNAFFSIVAPNGDAASEDLVVRARRKGDIERVFDVPGVASPGRDYAFRAQLPRDVVAAVLMWQVLGIDYGNFKSSVKDDALHDVYMAAWSVFGRLQVGGPYSRGHGNMRRPHSRNLFCPEESIYRESASGGLSYKR